MDRETYQKLFDEQLNRLMEQQMNHQEELRGSTTQTAPLGSEVKFSDSVILCESGAAQQPNMTTAGGSTRGSGTSDLLQ